MRMRAQSECSAPILSMRHAPRTRANPLSRSGMHVPGGLIGAIPRDGCLRIAAVAFDTDAAQNAEHDGNTDPDQQIHQGMAEVARYIWKEEHADPGVDQDGEDSTNCTTRHTTPPRQ